MVPTKGRRILLSFYGLDIGRARVSPSVWFGSSNMSIGDGSFINREVMFNTSERIEIGSNVDIGMRCLFVTSTHKLGGPERRAGAQQKGKILVGNGSWIGAGVTILPGVSLGSGCVVAAGAVVANSFPENSLIGGIPAKLIRQL